MAGVRPSRVVQALVETGAGPRGSLREIVEEPKAALDESSDPQLDVVDGDDVAAHKLASPRSAASPLTPTRVSQQLPYVGTGVDHTGELQELTELDGISTNSVVGLERCDDSEMELQLDEYVC